MGVALSPHPPMGLGGHGDQRGRKTRWRQCQGSHQMGEGQQPCTRKMGENRMKLHLERFLQGWSLKQGIGRLGEWIRSEFRILTYNFLKLIYPSSPCPRGAARLMLPEEHKK